MYSVVGKGGTWSGGGSLQGSIYLLYSMMQLLRGEGEGVELAQELLGIAVAQAQQGRDPSPPVCLRPLPPPASCPIQAKVRAGTLHSPSGCFCP